MSWRKILPVRNPCNYGYWSCLQDSDLLVVSSFLAILIEKLEGKVVDSRCKVVTVPVFRGLRVENDALKV